MVRAYFYLISFDDTNDIYIGKKTKYDVKKRLQQHKKDWSSSVFEYVKNKFHNDWSKVNIDIIDSIDMNENLTHLFNHPENIITDVKNDYKTYTFFYKTNEELLKHKLNYTEHFHIHNYNNNDKYNLINKKITNGYDVYENYVFYNYQNKIN